VPNIVCVSGLSILDCHFGFLSLLKPINSLLVASKLRAFTDLAIGTVHVYVVNISVVFGPS
jgi:hypothetical protein